MKTKCPWLHFYKVLLVLSWPNLLLGKTKAPHCSSSFHVWQPGQNAQEMIRDVYMKVDNLTSYTKYQLASIRVHLSEELRRIHNWTFEVDKRVFQIQIRKMDVEMAKIKDEKDSCKVQMLVDQTSRRLDDLERTVYSLRSKFRSGRSSNHRNHQHHDAPQQPTYQKQLDTIKNGVGDLKAEWLLLKRDIEKLKNKNRKETFLHAPATINKEFSSALETFSSKHKDLNDKIASIESKQKVIDEKLSEIQQSVKSINEQIKAQDVTAHSQANSIALLRDLYSQIKTNSIEDIGEEKLDNQENGTPLQLMKESKARIGERSNRNNTDASQLPKDCHEVFIQGYRVSSVYQIQPIGLPYMVSVYCEMINNTGYTLVQRRIDGTLGFNRRWLEYKQGFGNPYGETWLGNQLLHTLTKQKRYTLRFDLWDWEGSHFYAEYNKFRIDNEARQFKLHVGDYTGNAGDSFSYHDSMSFSTEDVDNDVMAGHCAAENKGGWWFHSCFLSHLNGKYHTAWYSHTQSNYADGIVWFTLKDSEFYSIKKVEMKLKPIFQ